jgi:hypothetical protein
MQWNRVMSIGALVGAVALAACDDDVDLPHISDFEGNWTASAVTYTAHADATRQVNIVALGGGLTLNLAADGTYAGVLTLPTATGPQPIPITGTVTLVPGSDNQADIVFNWPQGVPPQIDDFRATYSLQGNNLTFSRSDATFHFFMFGQTDPEPANLLIVMSR